MIKSGWIEVELSAAAAQLGTSERILRRRMDQGELSGRKIARKWYISLPVHMPGSALSESPVMGATVAMSPKHHTVEQMSTLTVSPEISNPAPSERCWARGYHGGYEPNSNDPVDQAFAVGRLAA